MRDLLLEPEVRNIDVDAVERLAAHRAVLNRKRMIRDVFVEMHHLFWRLDKDYFGQTPGSRIELGAGVAPVKETYSEVVATDVVAGAHHDRALDAMNMDIADNAVRALYLQNVFHHFPDPARFFTEAMRVVAPGGGIILIEPFHGAFSRILYPRLFASEGYDVEMPGWETPPSGPMNGANQALSYIVFKRDRREFQRRFSSLEIVHERAMTSWLRYLASGGLNFRALAPSFAAPALKLGETLLSPMRDILALHHVIVLRRRGE